MKYSGLIFAFLSLFATALMAQDDESTIVTLNNRDFTVGEFKQVYFKNLDLVKQQEERSLDEYLDLFIQYKRKVEAAKEQGLDQRQSYLTDFAKYQEQLSRNYVYEDNVTAQMVEQAYKRSKESLKTSHI